MTKPTHDLEPLLTVTDVARALKASVKTVRRRIDAGKLPVVRDGRIVRVRQKDLLAFIALRRCE